MLRCKKIKALFVCATLLAGCNSIQGKRAINVSGLAFYNDSTNYVKSVQLQSLKTGRLVSCNLVEPKSYCGTGFPAAQYSGAELKLTWLDHYGNMQSTQLAFPLPQTFDKDKPYVAVFKFNSETHFDTFFRLNPRPF